MKPLTLCSCGVGAIAIACAAFVVSGDAQESVHVARPVIASATSPNAAANGRDSTPTPATSGSAISVEPNEAASVVAVAVVEGEDERSATWDVLSRGERIEASRRDLDDALDSLQRGTGGPRAHAKADAALTALRAELYATATGRSEHRRLERKLDTIVERQRAGARTAGTSISPAEVRASHGARP